MHNYHIRSVYQKHVSIYIYVSLDAQTLPANLYSCTFNRIYLVYAKCTAAIIPLVAAANPNQHSHIPFDAAKTTVCHIVFLFIKYIRSSQRRYGQNTKPTSRRELSPTVFTPERCCVLHSQAPRVETRSNSILSGNLKIAGFLRGFYSQRNIHYTSIHIDHCLDGQFHFTAVVASTYIITRRSDRGFSKPTIF